MRMAGVVAGYRPDDEVSLVVDGSAPDSSAPAGEAVLRSVTSIDALHTTPSGLDSWCAS
jgi:hypothetical protein